MGRCPEGSRPFSFHAGRKTQGMEGKAQIGTVLEKIQKNEK